MKSHEGAKVVQAARDLAPSISARSAEIEAQRRLPADLLAQLKAAGFFRMFVPRSHGGYELEPQVGLDALETLARADGATGWTTMIGSESPHLFALLSRERFDAIYSAGPDVIVAGGFKAQGQAQVEPGGYRVSGRWAFASGCEHADYLFGNCVLLENGQTRPGVAEGVPAMRGMMFRNQDMRVLDTWSVLGLRGTGSHDITIEGAFCPEQDTFDIFQGKPSVPGPGFVATVLHLQLHMGAVAVGIAQGAIDDAVGMALGGKQRLYARTPLVQSQAFQLQLGRAEMSLRAARALLRDSASVFWKACTEAPATAMGQISQTSATLSWVTETAMGVVDACYRAGGGAAARDSSSLQRRFRDMHTFAQHAAVAEEFLLQMGASLLGQPTGLFT
jgi:alkylation response protein AidB-like acyl-CoA dehydrogenase